MKLTKANSTSGLHGQALWPLAILVTMCIGSYIYLGNRQDPEEISSQETMPEQAALTVSVSPLMLNSFTGGEVSLVYESEQPGSHTIEVIGPNGETVVQLANAVERAAGRQAWTWDGKGSDGLPVTDEAYTFRVRVEEKDNGTVLLYDPWSETGGDDLIPSDLRFDGETRAIHYVLPKASRVLVRTGIERGPSLRTLANWVPRPKGYCSEPWDGADQSGGRSFHSEERAKFMVQCYSLPRDAVLTFGVDDRSYVEMAAKSGMQMGGDLPHQAVEASLAIGKSPHWRRPIHLNRDPELDVREVIGVTPGENADWVITGGEALWRVDIKGTAAQKDYVSAQRAEIVAFVNDERVEEVELATLPHNLRIAPAELNLEPGKHWVTVNLVTLGQLVGIHSMSIEIPASDVEGQRSQIPPKAGKEEGSER